MTPHPLRAKVLVRRYCFADEVNLNIGKLLSIAPLFFPVLMQALGLLTGMIQAYIFAILAMVYIAAAVQRRDVGREFPPAQAALQRRLHG